jgi:hypothetical protein
VTNRGFTKSADFVVPADLNPQMKVVMKSMKQSMENISSPLPEEPVGVGAKWRVHQRIEMNGLKISQTSEFELKSVEEDRFNVDVTITQKAGEQEFSPPGLPAAGPKITLKSLESNGSGAFIYDSKSIMPAEGELNLVSKMKMSFAAGGQQQAIDNETVVDLRFDGVDDNSQ